jgi:ribosomal protein L18E
LNRKLNISAHAFSTSARAKIEAKGGTCELISSKPTRPAATEPTKS